MYLIWREVLSLSSQWGFFFPLVHLTLLWIYSSLLYPVCSSMYLASSDLAVKVTGSPPFECENFDFSLYITVQRFIIMLSEITITTPIATPKHMLIRAQLSPSSCLKYSSCKPTGGAAPSPPYTVRMLVLIRYVPFTLLHADNALPFNKRLLSLWRRECVCIHEPIWHPLTLGVCMVYSWGDFTQSWPVLSISAQAIVYSRSLSKSSCFYNAKAALYAT